MRVALALGSGGARGYAHIGVIDELLARDHEIVAVAGTSMGSVIGSLQAVGRLPEFTGWVRTLSQRDVLRLLDPAFGLPGAIRAQRVIDRVAEMLGGAAIEDLPIPFTAVASDLTTQREVWFQRGPVAMAVRASIAIPSVITPVMLDGRLLVDGALMNPVPMDPLAGVPADFTLAVDLAGRRRDRVSAQPTRESAAAVEGDLVDRVLRGAAGILDAEPLRALSVWLSGRFNRAVEPTDANPALDALPLAFEDLPRELRTADVVTLALDATSALITRFRMAANPPDVRVTLPINIASVFDFHRATELIDLGRAAAVEALDAAGH